MPNTKGASHAARRVNNISTWNMLMAQNTQLDQNRNVKLESELCDVGGLKKHTATPERNGCKGKLTAYTHTHTLWTDVFAYQKVSWALLNATPLSIYFLLVLLLVNFLFGFITPNNLGKKSCQNKWYVRMNWMYCSAKWNCIITQCRMLNGLDRKTKRSNYIMAYASPSLFQKTFTNVECVLCN